MGYKYIDEMTQDRKDSITNVIRIDFFRFLKDNEIFKFPAIYEKFLLQNPIRMNSLVDSVLKNLNSNKIAMCTSYDLDRLVIGENSADILWNKYPEQMARLYNAVCRADAKAALPDIQTILSDEEDMKTEDIYRPILFNNNMCEYVIKAMISLSTNLGEIRDCVDIVHNCIGERSIQLELFQNTIPLKIISILDTTGTAQIVVDHIDKVIMELVRVDYEELKEKQARGEPLY